MSSLEKIRDGFFEHLGAAASIVVTGLVAWLFARVAPAVLPVIQEKLPSQVMLVMLMLSLFVNIALTITTWCLSRKRIGLKLLYGILWDKSKNPYCPVCKNAGLAYGQWGGGVFPGYQCIPCNKVFGLQDAFGNKVTPEKAIGDLKA